MHFWPNMDAIISKLDVLFSALWWKNVHMWQIYHQVSATLLLFCLRLVCLKQPTMQCSGSSYLDGSADGRERARSFLMVFFLQFDPVGSAHWGALSAGSGDSSLWDVKSFLRKQELTYWQSWRSNDCSRNTNDWITPRKHQTSQTYRICVNLRWTSETQFDSCPNNAAATEMASRWSWRLHLKTQKP